MKKGIANTMGACQSTEANSYGMGWKEFTVGLPETKGEQDWAVLPEEQLSWEVLEDVWAQLVNVNVDVVKRILIWPDGARLGVSESVQRVHNKFSDFPLDMVEAYLVGWLEQEYVPEGYSQAQIAQFEELMGKWVDELQGIDVDFGDTDS